MDWMNGVAGLLVGIVVGLTGVGGGSLMSPLLILFFGVAPATAIGTDLWFAAITKSVGGYVHYRQRTVALDIVGLLAIGSVPAAVLTGLWLWHNGGATMRSDVLSQALGAVLILTSIATLLRRRVGDFALSLTIRQHPRFTQFKRAATILCGAILGSLVTLTSVGAGALGATMLLFLYPRRLSLHRLVGTDIAHAVPIALVGGIIHLVVGSVDWWLLAALLVGSIPGIVIGSRLAVIVPEAVIRPALAIVLIFAGVKLLT